MLKKEERSKTPQKKETSGPILDSEQGAVAAVSERQFRSMPQLTLMAYLADRMPHEMLPPVLEAANTAYENYSKKVLEKLKTEGIDLKELEKRNETVQPETTSPVKETLVKEEEPGGDDKRKETNEDAIKEANKIEKSSCAALLSLLSIQARILAEDELREAEKLCCDLLDAKMKRIEVKMEQLDEMEELLEAERHALQIDRADLFSQQARHWGRA